MTSEAEKLAPVGVVIGGAGPGTAPCAGLQPQQLVGGSVYPPSAFAGHGDPLMDASKHVTAEAVHAGGRAGDVSGRPMRMVIQSTTDAGMTGLPHHDYACAPSRDAHHGDARVGRNSAHGIVDADIIAPDFSAGGVSVAQPDPNDAVRSTPRDHDEAMGGAAPIRYGAAAATDAARLAVVGRQRRSPVAAPSNYDPAALTSGRGEGLVDAELMEEGGDGGGNSSGKRDTAAAAQFGALMMV